MVRFNEVSGSPFNRGFQAGVLFKDALRRRVKEYLGIFDDSELVENIQKVLTKTESFYPDYIEEVRGRAAGAEIDVNIYLAMMCPELLGEETGCTTVITRKESGHFILSHNEDDDYTEDNFAITKVNLLDGSWFVTNDPDKMPFGNGYSWNSHGVVKVINYTHAIENNLTGIPRYFAQRHISEATSLEDFVTRCSTPDRASGYHALALDVKTNKAISVEVTSETVSVLDIGLTYCHANHYTHDKICRGITYTDQDSNSPFRLGKATELVKVCNNPSLFDVRSILELQGETYRDSILIAKGQTDYNTVSNFSIDTEHKMVHLKFYHGDSPLEYVMPLDGSEYTVKGE